MPKKESNQKREPKVILKIEPLRCNSISDNNRLLAYAKGLKGLIQKKEV